MCVPSENRKIRATVSLGGNLLPVSTLILVWTGARLYHPSTVSTNPSTDETACSPKLRYAQTDDAAVPSSVCFLLSVARGACPCVTWHRQGGAMRRDLLDLRGKLYSTHNTLHRSGRKLFLVSHKHGRSDVIGWPVGVKKKWTKELTGLFGVRISVTVRLDQEGVRLKICLPPEQ